MWNEKGDAQSQAVVKPQIVTHRRAFPVLLVTKGQRNLNRNRRLLGFMQTFSLFKMFFEMPEFRNEQKDPMCFVEGGLGRRNQVSRRHLVVPLAVHNRDLTFLCHTSCASHPFLIQILDPRLTGSENLVRRKWRAIVQMSG